MSNGRTKKVQAKSITDDDVFLAMEYRQVASLFDIEDNLDAFPRKVVLAKLRSMVKRGVLSGCTCGCRGNFRKAAT